MPRVSVSQRTRQTLFRLFRNPAFSKSGLASYCQKPASWLSSFLHPGKRSTNPSFHLDELDDIAAYFRIGLGELLGAPVPGELSGDETRLLLAFRGLAPATQEHVIRILEQLSLVPRTLQNRPLHMPEELGQNAGTEVSSHGRPLSSPDALRYIGTILHRVMGELAEAGAATVLDGPLPSARPKESPPGHVAR